MIEAQILDNHKIMISKNAISDSVRYETIKFSFPKLWTNYVKTAVFKSGDMVVSVLLDKGNELCLSENECYIPHEVLNFPGFSLSVFGNEGNTLATTASGFVTVLQSGYAQGEAPKEPTPSEYSQVLALMNETKDIARSVREDADNGAFKGDKGDTGPQGVQGIQGPKGDKGDVGPQGPQGDKGEKGDAGSSGVYVGTEEPTDENVNVWINPEVEADDIVPFTHKWNGTVLTITSASGTSSADLKGEKGDTGPQGPQGEKGETGDVGPQGETGPQGIQGVQGEKGDTGASGQKGADGYSPVKGTDYWTEEDKSEIINEVVEEIGENTDLPDYVITEAESVISRVMEAQGDRTFNIIVMSDLHNNGGVSDAQILHACQGAEYIANRVKVDAFICLGDHTDTFGKDNWTECLSDIFNCNNHKSRVKADRLEILGNHDFRTAKSPLTYKTISAYSEDVVWGDRLGGYFYKDYEDYKLRIIGLNTSEASYIGVSSTQYNWLIDILDMSAKEDATEWQILVLSHVPLDWSTTFSPFTNIFNAYIKGTSWTDGTYSCDYTNKNQATLIGTVHGHIHNLMLSQMALGGSVANGLIDLYRIAIPEVTESYGNHYEAPFKHDTTYSKTANTAKDTAFNVLCIDLDTKKINAICYGAGVDRVIDYDVFGADDNSTNTIALNFATGKINTSTGEIDSENRIYAYSDLIKIEDHTSYLFKWEDCAICVKVCYYDAEGNFLSATNDLYTGADLTVTSGSVMIPIIDTAVYFRIRCYLNQVEDTNYPDDDTTDTNTDYLYEASFAHLTDGSVLTKTSSDYTNQIPISISSDGRTYNNGQGWKTETRLNSSGGESVLENWEVSGFIPITQNSIVRFANIDWNGDEQGKDYLAIYDSNFNCLGSGVLRTWFVNTEASDYLTNSKAVVDDNGYVTYLNLSCLVTGNFANGGEALSEMAYIRISAYEINDNSIITVDEEIVYPIAITWTRNVKIDKDTGEETSDEKHQYCCSQFIELNLDSIYEMTVSNWYYQGSDSYDISISCCYYDEGKNYLGYAEITKGQTTETLTPISGAKWLKIRVWVGSGNDYQDEYLSQVSLARIY